MDQPRRQSSMSTSRFSVLLHMLVAEVVKMTLEFRELEGLLTRGFAKSAADPIIRVVVGQLTPQSRQLIDLYQDTNSAMAVSALANRLYADIFPVLELEIPIHAYPHGKRSILSRTIATEIVWRLEGNESIAQFVRQTPPRTPTKY